MKKVLLTLSLALSFNSFAQLVVKEQVKDSVVWKQSLSTVPKLVMFKYEDDNEYVMYFKNMKYTTFTDIDYFVVGDKQTSIQFFELCKKVISTGEDVELELYNKPFVLKKIDKSVFIYVQGAYFYLSANQLESIILSL